MDYIKNIKKIQDEIKDQMEICDEETKEWYQTMLDIADDHLTTVIINKKMECVLNEVGKRLQVLINQLDPSDKILPELQYIVMIMQSLYYNDNEIELD